MRVSAARSFIQGVVDFTSNDADIVIHHQDRDGLLWHHGIDIERVNTGVGTRLGQDPGIQFNPGEQPVLAIGQFVAGKAPVPALEGQRACQWLVAAFTIDHQRFALAQRCGNRPADHWPVVIGRAAI